MASKDVCRSSKSRLRGVRASIQRDWRHVTRPAIKYLSINQYERWRSVAESDVSKPRFHKCNKLRRVSASIQRDWRHVTRTARIKDHQMKTYGGSE